MARARCLLLNAIIGLVIVARTLAMWYAGLMLSPAQMAAYAGSLVLLTLLATRLALRLFLAIPDAAPS
jgi:uncharacterized membrane protein required for colicin V production